MITEKVTKLIGTLRRLKSYLPLSVLVIIYMSLIQPHFDYHSSVCMRQFREGLGMQASKITKSSCMDYYGVRLQCSFRSDFELGKLG